MKQMMKAAGAVAAAVMAATMASTAHAALSVADLYQPGDGFLTVDSVTGLVWLDIGATRGLSVADVIAPGNGLSPDWLGQGFRFAKASEFDQLVQQGAQQLDFMAWLGAWDAPLDVSATLGGPTTVLAGVLAGDGLAPDGSVRADTLLLTRDTRITEGGGSLGDFLRRFTESVSPLAASPNRGVFLVKDVSPVPEPAAMALMGIGLVGVFSVARRRRAD